MALTPISRKFAKKIKVLSWVEIRHGIEQKWLEPSIAIDRAMDLVSSDEYSELEFEMASLGYDQSNEVMTTLNRICPCVTENDIDAEKWSKILLTWLLLNKSDYSDPLQEIEIIYADLGYPEEIAHLVRYMPSESPRDLFVKWATYTSKNDHLSDAN